MENPSQNPVTRQESLKNFYDFHDLMVDNEIILVYTGDFSQELTKILLAFTERKFSIDNLEDIVRRRIFNIMVEMLQNISKNAVDAGNPSPKESALFMISENDEAYNLISSNKIAEDCIPGLRERLEEVNSLDGDGLKALYKKVRLNSSFSKVGGAGIGIIDMARKSGHKLIYDFSPLDEKHSVFSLFITVSKTYN